ncbi:hypothetical protein BU25DRAFT_183724 [Macroventuria anomochaeta]|uniref:Uncharacterized protein n=1 Tax=Macroventuria anomochaeta TaxID=301207 RepID=A0ACB6RN64_9PLEO|nr:uncharacterized protein BU25DRAFT_183724 [Macroventuria anomochaeta]KAF2623162.1 hypothetical protein BU25DRAFT_183724 [Macroventuria anomochaeta]
MYEVQLASRALQVRNEKLQKRHRILSMLLTVEHVSKYLRLCRQRHPGTTEWTKSTAQYSNLLSNKILAVFTFVECRVLGNQFSQRVLWSHSMPHMAPVPALYAIYYCDFADTASLDSYFSVAVVQTAEEEETES